MHGSFVRKFAGTLAGLFLFGASFPAFAWQPGPARLGSEAAGVHQPATAFIEKAPLSLSVYVEGEVLVKMKERAAPVSEENMAQDLAVGKVKKLKSDRAAPRTYLLKLKAGDNVEDKVRELLSRPDVEAAQPNYFYHAALAPNDEYFNQLWGLNNTGQTIGGQAGIPGADIHMPAAWDKTTGSTDIVVGVVDTGIDYMSPDLVDNLWVNPGEIPGNAIDDDGDGYVDDVHGINAIAGTGDPYDDNMHGTHVSGTIGAKGNNVEGVTGVNWNTRIMALKFLDSTGSGTTAGAVECINYAINMKAKGTNIRVLSASWGAGASDPALETAIINAGNADILFVAAAGNDASDNDVTPFYPAAYPVPNLIAVAATDNTDSLAWFSNYGYTSVDVAAPGVYILSTVPVVNTLSSDNFDPVIGPWSFGGANSTWAVTTESCYSPTHSITDSPGGPYQPSTNTWAILGPLDFSKAPSSLTLKYYMDLDTMPYFDWLWIEDSSDGLNWTTVDGWSGSTGGYMPASHDISSLAGTGTAYIRFRLQAGPWSSNDGVHLDDVSITTRPTSVPASGDYMYASGTSMATPHVSGLAALLLSAKPGLTATQVKDAIMNTVDPLGLPIVTGGRINAAKAVSSVSDTNPPPNITGVSPSSALPGANVTITGSHFGGSKGTVYLTAGSTTSVTPTTWTDTAITFTVPNITAGTYMLTVANSAATSNAVQFTVNSPPLPNITGVSPSSASPGVNVTITGSHFGDAQGTVYLTLKSSSTSMVPAVWTDTAISFTVPKLKPGTYMLTVKNSVGTSNAVPFSIVRSKRL